MQEYLTRELKEYYQNEIQKNSQKLDPGVLPYLDRVNSSPELQTLLSKKFNQHVGDTESNLYLAYTENSREKVQSRITNLKKEIEKLGTSEFVVNWKDPVLDEPLDPESYEGWLNNGEYFNLKHIELFLHDPLPEAHSLFWDSIAKLSE